MLWSWYLNMSITYRIRILIYRVKGRWWCCGNITCGTTFSSFLTFTHWPGQFSPPHELGACPIHIWLHTIAPTLGVQQILASPLIFPWPKVPKLHNPSTISGKWLHHSIIRLQLNPVGLLMVIWTEILSCWPWSWGVSRVLMVAVLVCTAASEDAWVSQGCWISKQGGYRWLWVQKTKKEQIAALCREGWFIQFQ